MSGPAARQADAAFEALLRLVPEADRGKIPRPDPARVEAAEKAEMVKQDRRADILDRLARLCKTDVPSLVEAIYAPAPTVEVDAPEAGPMVTL